MFKQVKKGKMLEINERKKSWCGGSTNVDCGACDAATNPDLSVAQFDGYHEMLEKW